MGVSKLWNQYRGKYMQKLTLNTNKTLKLTNVLVYQAQLQAENEVGIDVQLEQMKTYIKTKGAMQIGPLIQYVTSDISEHGELDVHISFLMQCNHEIHAVEKPYTMKNILRVPNCLYCRYIGAEETLKYAYDKISLYAFENDIKLKGESYTVFVSNDEGNDAMIADVFMEKDNDKAD